jgi:hypothetical protein
MAFEGMLTQLLMSLGSQFPLLAVWILGVVLAMAFWRRDPRNGLLVLLACLVCLFTDVGFTIAYAVLPQYLHNMMNGSPFSIRWIYSGLGFVRACLIALAWTLLLAAVFRRNPVA